MSVVKYLAILTVYTVTADAAALVDSASMASVDYSKVPIVEKALYTPPLQELADVLSAGLTATFKSVEVSVADTPDLTQPPYNLTAKGLNGDVKLVEIGGPPYLLPLVRRDKVFDLKQLAQHLRRDPAFLAGAGAGPWPHIGVNCEGIVNLLLEGGSVHQGTRVVSVEPVGAPKGASGYLQRRLPDTETRTALLGNYLLSQGAPGKAIKVVAKTRIGKSNFITAIRETLRDHYGDKVVGLGGTFMLLSGEAKYHVMPDFSPTPLCSDSDVDTWLHYFQLRAPIVNVGTLVTGDHGLDLRVQHFHGWGAASGGHYHYDTSPGEAHYEGYFVPAAAILRVDAPHDTHAIGRD